MKKVVTKHFGEFGEDLFINRIGRLSTGLEVLGTPLPLLGAPPVPGARQGGERRVTGGGGSPPPRGEPPASRLVAQVARSSRGARRRDGAALGDQRPPPPRRGDRARALRGAARGDCPLRSPPRRGGEPPGPSPLVAWREAPAAPAAPGAATEGAAGSEGPPRRRAENVPGALRQPAPRRLTTRRGRTRGPWHPGGRCAWRCAPPGAERPRAAGHPRIFRLLHHAIPPPPSTAAAAPNGNRAPSHPSTLSPKVPPPPPPPPPPPGVQPGPPFPLG